MMGVTIKTDGIKSAIEKYVKGLGYIAEVGLVEAATAAKESAVATMKATTTRRTGELEDSWTQSWRGPYTRQLTNFSDHAVFVENGTRPHKIVAKNAKFLRFEMGGVTMFRRSVNHPGTKPRPFVALAQAVGQMTLRASLTAGANGLASRF